ncbi:MAG: DUF2235 domain-containing protein [Litorimonas sp.]
MTKNILIFSDGTGQIGGLKPDQKLSNIYKMYRAMRPGPSSPINPSDQIAYYDPGLGAGEIDGLTFRKVRQGLEAAVGTGIDQNVIDCYEKIISYYKPGDCVLMFGFSRGAYTVRALANVMNLCGVPTKMPDGSPVPVTGPRLRALATEGVIEVYNHGAGRPRGEKPFYAQREEKGRRFRLKYGSAPLHGPDVQGNVQPEFIGVFDTVAALGNSAVTWLVRGTFTILLITFLVSILLNWHLAFSITAAGLLAVTTVWYLRIVKSQIRVFSPDPDRPLKFSRIRDWASIFKNMHRAVWNRKNYDRFLDADVGYARHALAIDEHRANFPRVKWASQSQMDRNLDKKPEWLKQVWFAGCHSDIGGSYDESEARLSDIALEWMVEELEECVPDIQIRKELLVCSPDALGLQHREEFMFRFGPFKKRWPVQPRIVDPGYTLHKTVFERLSATIVPQVGDMEAYRPVQLREHPKAKKFYK